MCLARVTLSANGEAHAENGSPSTRHSKLEPGSLKVKSKLAFRFLVFFAGRR